MASRDKKKGEAKQERNYQIKPLFKDKFRPAEARKLIEEVVNEKLKNDKANSAIWKEESFVRTVHSMLEGYSYDLDVRKFVLFELLN